MSFEMKATCLHPELMRNNGSWLKDPYVRPGASRKDPVNEVFEIDFNLCVIDDDNIEHVVDVCTLSFDDTDRDAMIRVDGTPIPLLPHLMANGSAGYVAEDMEDYGLPAYSALGSYFVDSFGLMEFMDQPLLFFVKIWALQHIEFEGVLIRENFTFN